MNCVVSEEQLALYSSNDLSPKESAAVSNHLWSCEQCRDTLADLQFSQQLVAETYTKQPDEEDIRLVQIAVMQQFGRQRKRNHWLQMTAVAAGLVLVIGLPLRPNKPPHKRFPAPVTSLQTLPILPTPALELPALVPAQTVHHHRHKRDTGAGLREVALRAGPDGRYQLKMATADPDVIILFPMDENTHAN